MVPMHYSGGIYVDGIMVIRLYPSEGRPRSHGDGHGLWSYNFHPLGWVDDGLYRVECAAAALLVRGDLTPQWEQTANGLTLVYPRYTLVVEQVGNGWRPRISDDLSGFSHSLHSTQTCAEAVAVLEDLIRRHLGRARPDFDPYEYSVRQRCELQLALSLVRPKISALIRNEPEDNDDQWSDQTETARQLAHHLNRKMRYRLDEYPRLVTLVASHLKTQLLKIYSGVSSEILFPAATPLALSPHEIAALRARFRRSPMTDAEYLDFVKTNLDRHLVGVRRKHLHNGSIVGLRSLHPKRDKREYPMSWPPEPGTRLGEECMRGPWWRPMQ